MPEAAATAAHQAERGERAGRGAGRPVVEPGPACPVQGWELAVLVAALATGAALRLAVLRDLSGALLFQEPALDSHEYLMWARAIRSGHLLWGQVAAHSPLYPYVLAGLLAISADRLALVRDAQALVVGVGGGAAVWALGRACAGRLAAATSVWMAATLWPLVYHDGELLVESLVVLLGTLALLALVRARGRWPGLALAGGLLGLAVLTRPTGAAFVPVAALWAGWPGRPGTDGPRTWAAAGRRAAAVAFAAALVVAPAVLHNHAISGRWILQDHGGLNFYLGNSPGADGTPNVRAGRPWALLLRMPAARGIMDPAAQDAFYWTAALRWWRDAPGPAVRLFGRKLFLFWNAYETRSSLDIYYFRRLSPTLSLPWPGFGLLAPLALFGVGAAVLRRTRDTDLLVLYAATCTVATAVFVVSGRYRLPVLPAALPLAGLALSRLAETARRGRRGQAVVGGVAVVALAVAVHLTPGDVRVREQGDERYNEARVLLARGQLADAERAFRAAWAERPEDGRIATNLGSLFVQTGRPAEGLEWLRRAVALYPEAPEPWAGLGLAAARTGHPEEAEHAFGESLRLDPRRATTHLAAGAFLLERGERARAIEHLREAQRLGVALPPDARALVEGASP